MDQQKNTRDTSLPASPRVTGGNGQALTWALAVPPALLAALFAGLIPVISSGDTIRIAYDWVPSLGVQLSFYIDGLSLTFALLISGIGAFVTLYSGTYLGNRSDLGRFYVYLFSFMGAMLGLVLADNLITLFVFWELTTIASYLLIGLDHASPKARRAALQALLLTGTGGLALLAGFILLGSAAGTFELSEIISQPGAVRDHALYLPILILVLLGAFTKSAQVPFHFWLPNAMAAPTPVSAYLHSATMVKAGIYLLARLHPTLSGTDVWIWSLTIAGAVTAVFASFLALKQTDLKLALAYTTLMALGTLTMFLGAEATVAVAAAITFLIVHSLYKAALFLVVGVIDRETGTRDVAHLAGLAKAMPITAVAAATAALSMAGFPPFLGFIGKELKYEGALAIASEPVFVASAAVLANALMVAIAGILALKPFLGDQKPTLRLPHEPPFALWVGPAVLALLGLVCGLMPSLIAGPLVQPAVTAILGRPETVKLALWHGINVPLMLSILTFAFGVTIYAFHERLRSGLAALGSRVPINADRLWDRLLNGLKAIAAWQTRLLQNGHLTRYLAVTFSAFVVIVGGTLLTSGGIRLPNEMPDLLIKEWAVIALIVSGTGLAIYSRSRLAAVCALGIVGVSVALLFVMFGAPDVAITQLLVETLVVVLLTAAMLRLPRIEKTSFSVGQIGRAGLALSVGAVVTLTLMSLLDTPFDRTVTAYYETASVPDAYGRNIVNVILVDFRALDTFGEVAVVAVAAIAAYALIRRRPKGSPS